MNHPLAYSIREAVEATRLGRTTLYEAIRRGDLKAVKVGRRTLIRTTDLRDWLASL